MKKLLGYLALVVSLVGCAVNIESRMLERGDFVEAYVLNADATSGAKADAKSRVVAEILNKTGGAKGTKFKELLVTYIENQAQNEWLFSALPQLLAQGEKDGLISSSQHLELNDQVLYLLGKASIESPSILKNPTIQVAYPELSRYRAKIAIGEFEKLQVDPNASLKQYIPIYRLFSESNDGVSTQRVLKAMRVKAENQLKSDELATSSVTSFEPFFEYIKLTQDRTLDESILRSLAKVRVTRAELTNGNIPLLFPSFSKEKLESSVIKLNVTSQNDEFIVGEIVEVLKKRNEWLEITEEAKRKLTIGRIRFQENRTNPTNMTETVQQLNFVTLLMIPKNASVLFDYSVSEYSLQWNMSIMDSQTKVTKAISGQRKGKKIECRNVRYQNVFGGTGPLYAMPNDAVASFCQSNANADFDGIRTEALGEIANEINNTFLLSDGNADLVKPGQSLKCDKWGNPRDAKGNPCTSA